jgi:excisionase family DNA binding protein
VEDRVEWLSSPQAAEELGVSARTLYKFINDGMLPGYRFGRVIRVRRSDVEIFLERIRIKPGELDHLSADLKATSQSTESM